MEHSMTEQNPPSDQPASTTPPPQPPPAYEAPPAPPGMAGQQPPPPPAPYPGGYPAPGFAPGAGPVGRVRSTGVCILLYFVTLGFYGWYYYYSVHNEMKQHSNRGIGGGIALVLAIFVGIVLPYITSSEVGALYETRGQQKPVSAATGLWAFPGALIIVGPFIWFIKTNGALNDYWQSLGAQ
jgi:hypothetical protein